MKKLQGVSLNINRSMLGKIVTNPYGWFNKRDHILFSRNGTIRKGYAAVITDKFVEKNIKDVSIIHSIESGESIKNGDIVLMEPSGTITILYEKKVFDNSLMVTDRCNCSCIMCPQPPVTYEEDKTLFNLKLISLMDRKMRFLGLTGGEPTLTGDALIDIISACKKTLPKTELNLLTNGIKFEDFDYVKKIVMVRHPNLFIEIPLYSDTDTEHNSIIRAKGFYKMIKGLYNLALFRQRTGLRIVVLRQNYKRLLNLAEFIYHNFPFVNHVAFMQMETTGLAKKNIEDIWIDPFDYNDQLEKAIVFLAHRDMNVSVYNAQLCLLPEKLWKYSRKSISSWKNIYLDICNSCDYKEQCGGFFASSADKHSEYIKPLKK